MDFSFVQSVRLLTISFPLPDPPSSRVLVQKDPSSPVADGSYRPMCSSFRYAHALLLPFYVKSTPCAEEICADESREMKKTESYSITSRDDVRRRAIQLTISYSDRPPQSLSDNENAMTGETDVYN